MQATLQSNGTEYLPIADIVINGGTQSRAELNWDVIAEYAEAMSEGVIFPPVLVFYDGFNYWLADGFHRLHAAQKAELTEIAVEVRQGSLRDAVLNSVGANANHGLRRTNADKRRAVVLLLRDEEWGQWSDNRIAKASGVSHTFVGKLRASIFPSCNGCKIQRTGQRNGKTYILDTTNIGSATDAQKQPTRANGTTLEEAPAPAPESKLPLPDDEREWVRIATDRPHLSQWNKRMGVVVARTRGSVYVSIDGYTPSFQESEVQLLDRQPLPNLQSSVDGVQLQSYNEPTSYERDRQPSNECLHAISSKNGRVVSEEQSPSSQPTSVKDELKKKALELGLPSNGAQVLPSLPRNNVSPADVDDRPNVYSPPPPIPVDTNEICTNFIGSIEYLSHEHIVATVSELATRTNPKQLDLMGDEELKLFVNKLNLLAETATKLLNKRHNPSYFNNK